MMWSLFDAEWNGLGIENVTKLWCIVVYNLIDGNIYEYGPDEVEQGLKLLSESSRLIGHNIITADLPVFEKLYGWRPSKDQIILDTLMLSRLSYPDRQKPWEMPSSKTGPHSIEAWGYRLGKHKQEHEDWSQFSDEMMNRCKQDVLINVDVYNAIYKEMNA